MSDHEHIVGTATLAERLGVSRSAVPKLLPRLIACGLREVRLDRKRRFLASSIDPCLLQLAKDAE